MPQSTEVILEKNDYTILPLEEHLPERGLLTLSDTQHILADAPPTEKEAFLASLGYLHKLQELLDFSSASFLDVGVHAHQIQTLIECLMDEVREAVHRSTLNLILLGHIVTVCDQLGLAKKLEGQYSNMYEYLTIGNNISPMVLGLAHEVYSVWLHVKDYGISIERMGAASQVKIQAIRQADRQRDERYGELLKEQVSQLQEQEPELASSERTAKARKQAKEALQDEMRERINDILDKPDFVVLGEIPMPPSEHKKPSIYLTATYNPRTQQLCLQGSCTADLATLDAMEKQGLTYIVKIEGMPKSGTAAQLATYILKQCPPDADDADFF